YKLIIILTIRKLLPMSQELKLRTNETPTFFNKEAAIGFLIAPHLAIGAVVGGIIGKNRMKKELTHGKPVGESSTLNKDTLLGGMIGLTIGGAITTLILMSQTATIAAAAATIGTIGTAIIGAVIGSKHGKRTQEKEYVEALHQQSEQQMEKSPSVSKNVTQEYGHEVKANHAATIQKEQAAASQQKQI
ncbi:MAG: hypothetical protein ABL857_08175, partial [Rickettsiales bacterium]